jgi:hypothetical protein
MRQRRMRGRAVDEHDVAAKKQQLSVVFSDKGVFATGGERGEEAVAEELTLGRGYGCRRRVV